MQKIITQNLSNFLRNKINYSTKVKIISILKFHSFVINFLMFLFSKKSRDINAKKILIELNTGLIGRYLLPFINAFIQKGYKVDFSYNYFFFSQLNNYGKYIFDRSNLVFKPKRQDYNYIFSNYKSGKNTILLSFDYFSTYKEDGIVYPFPINPVLIKNKIPITKGSKCKNNFIFFAGNFKTYTSNELLDKFSIIPRKDIIEKLHEISLDNHSIKIIDVKVEPIPIEKWYHELSRATFFVCPPGNYMPFCHHLKEAMSLGVIPIIEYSDLLFPHLEHNVNCINYNSIKDFEIKIQSILSMDDQKINWMSENCLDYYQNYMSDDSFIDKVVTTKKNKIYFNAGWLSVMLKK